MSQDGIVIGSHTVNHPVMGRLSSIEQEKEIYDPFYIFKSITGFKDFQTFCYPYGGFHSFTKKTIFSIENRHCLDMIAMNSLLEVLEKSKINNNSFKF